MFSGDQCGKAEETIDFYAAVSLVVRCESKEKTDRY